MASLTGQSISTTYDSLLKLTDNGPITSSFKEITDGLGNSSGVFLKSTGQIKLGNYTTTTSFTGTAAGYLAFTSSGEIITTAAPGGGISSLNALTASTQTFAVGISGTDFAISSATSTHTFNLPTASATNRGALSSTDWTTFNGKVGGSGTTNYVPKFSGSTSIANSLVYDTGTAIGIGTTSPSATLDVYRASGETTLQISSGTEYLRLFYRDSDDNCGIFINGATRLRLIGSAGNATILENGSGNFGVGTSNPQYKLDVAGGINYRNQFNRQTASYTLVLSDASKIVEMNVAGANNLTVPLNSSVAFPIGTEIQVLQYGNGQTTIVPFSVGVVLNSKSGQLKIANKFTGVTLVKVGTDEWYVIGNLTA